MTRSAEEALNELRGYVDQGGDPYAFWFVGISKDAQARLRERHNVGDTDQWHWVETENEEEAHRTEDHLVAAGLTGDTGHGPPEKGETQVYVFHMDEHTQPSRTRPKS